jgi:DNA-binding MarR family transcriptional regulator
MPATDAAKPPTQTEYAKAAALREALRRFQRQTEVVADASGLTPRTYQLLLMIKTSRSGRDRSGLAELEERLQLGKSTVTELVTRAEKRRLVKRELNRERPGTLSVAITPAGERRLARVFTELGDERQRLIELLSTL